MTQGRGPIRDSAALKAFAHPLRVRLYYALGAKGPATASALAGADSVSLVSYHLHKLAECGFIEAMDSPTGDGRERWWRLSEQELEWSPTDFLDDPERHAVSTAVRRGLLAHQLARVQQYLNEEPSWGGDWADAAFSSDSLLELTPAELRAMQQEIQAVVRKFSRRAGAERRRGESAERAHVMYLMHGFPFRP